MIEGQQGWTQARASSAAALGAPQISFLDNGWKSGFYIHAWIYIAKDGMSLQTRSLKTEVSKTKSKKTKRARKSKTVDCRWKWHENQFCEFADQLGAQQYWCFYLE